ncbi:MAG: hypothetical protein ABI887_03550 [Burkholderiales bacterium]
MADSRLLENTFAAANPGSLFHSAAFFKMHAQDRGAYFEWEQDGRVVATIHFTPAGDGLWRSPGRGTYAGFTASTDLHSEHLYTFHDAVLARLAALGARRVEILPAPMAHDPVAFSNQTHLLHARGYAITQCDVNHSLVVDGRGMAERMSYGNQKRLRKCAKEGLHGRLLPPSALPQVYDTLAANRQSKGHAMSMSLAQLQAMQQTFPDAMLLFGCQHGDVQAATALCLRLSADVLYVFYWGDRPGHANLSPVVSVAEAVYAHCQTEGIRLLDVGTSSVDREPNFGLIQFKRGLGFAESLKLRMARDI